MLFYSFCSRSADRRDCNEDKHKYDENAKHQYEAPESHRNGYQPGAFRATAIFVI